MNSFKHCPKHMKILSCVDQSVSGNKAKAATQPDMQGGKGPFVFVPADLFQKKMQHISAYESKWW